MCNTKLWFLLCKNLRKGKVNNLRLFTKGVLENFILSDELNLKFNLNTKVISHKKIYYVIITKSTDALKIVCLIKKYMITSMEYKLPKQS